jgi:hypothetical protein
MRPAPFSQSVILMVGLLAGSACSDNREAADKVVAKEEAARADSFPEFQERVKKYLDAKKRAETIVPELEDTSDPKKITQRERALGDAVRAVRPDAKQGDLFSEQTTAEFRRVIEADFAKRTPADTTAVLEEVPARTIPHVNETYPPSLPLATVPPSLLLALPTLPDGLEYRFFGRHLIIRDVTANVIVDYIPNAIPAAQ